MSRVKDLSGQYFGKLTVIEMVGLNKHKRALWLCKCDCGNDCVVTSQELVKGDTKSCGCLNKEAVSRANKKDIANKRFGKLVVIQEDGKDSRGNIKWECKCDCGNIVTVSGALLRSGHTRSCGCLKKDSLETLWSDEGFKSKMKQLRTDMNNEMWSDDETKVKLKNAIKDSWENNERREVASQRMKEQWLDEQFRKSNSGKNHIRYNENLTEEDRKRKRNIQGYDTWKRSVKKEANYICDCCGYKGNENDGHMVAHHLEGFNQNKELRTTVSNGVCLCKECHKDFHKLYGKGNNTKEQYIEFKKLIANTN